MARYGALKARDHGPRHAVLDTASMAIVATKSGELIPCTGGSSQVAGVHAVRALSFEQVDAISERFRVLSPYDEDAVPGSILKVEAINFDERGQQRQLYAYAISAKRYCLYTPAEDGEPQIVKCSEHGLGHLLNPVDPERTDRDWIRQLWELLVRQALGRPAEEPDWLDRPALTKIAITSPQVLRPFAAYNEGRPTREQIAPYNFLL